MCVRGSAVYLEDLKGGAELWFEEKVEDLTAVGFTVVGEEAGGGPST